MAKSNPTEKKRVAIYARVSTDGQTTENQLSELCKVARRHRWKVVKEYVDNGISGAAGREKRLAFDEMCKAAVRKEFDIIASWSVDRLGRSLQHLVAFLGEVHAKGVDLYLHQQAVDTTTPAGRALFQMMAVFAAIAMRCSSCYGRYFRSISYVIARRMIAHISRVPSDIHSSNSRTTLSTTESGSVRIVRLTLPAMASARLAIESTIQLPPTLSVVVAPAPLAIVRSRSEYSASTKKLLDSTPL